MENRAETSPFTYSKNTNYFAKTFRQINECLELTEKEVRILVIFVILRIADLALTYIFYNKRNAYHLIRFMNYFALFLSFIVTSLIFINKDSVKQRAVMSSILFNFVFIIFDIMSFIFYFAFEVDTMIILISLILNEIWLVITLVVLFKIISKIRKILKNNKNTRYKRETHGNSYYLRKNY